MVKGLNLFLLSILALRLLFIDIAVSGLMLKRWEEGC